MQTIHSKIQQTLERIRPYLQKDKGDIELVNISSDGIVEVRFLGNCTKCPLLPLTLRAGVERAILLDVAEVRRVEAVK